LIPKGSLRNATNWLHDFQSKSEAFWVEFYATVLLPFP